MVFTVAQCLDLDPETVSMPYQYRGSQDVRKLPSVLDWS